MNDYPTKTEYLSLVLETDYNINPDEIVNRADDRYTLIYRPTATELLYNGNKLENVRKSIADSFADNPVSFINSIHSRVFHNEIRVYIYAPDVSFKD